MADPIKQPAQTKRPRERNNGRTRKLPEFHIFATQVSDGKQIDIDVAHGTREAKAVARTLKKWCGDKLKDIAARKMSNLNFD